MIRIGLTGGIASGKSVVAGILQDLGAYVLDADRISRQAVEPGSTGLAQIVEQFGTDILRADGTLNRKKLGGIVFSHAEKRNILNGILHPIVFNVLENQTRQVETCNPQSIVVWDVPLLIECGMQRSVDQVWVVTAPVSERIARIMKRDGCSRTEALLRINAQMPQEEKQKYADVLIDNCGDMSDLTQTILERFKALRQ